MAHTPGPWKIDENCPTDHGRICIHDAEIDLHICEAISGMFGKNGTVEDNARLIAAAPDLLEACKVGFQLVLGQLGQLRAKFGDIEDCKYCGRTGMEADKCAGHLHIEMLQNRAKAIEAAIAKAEGK